jgi:hypothetical protein
MAAAPIPSAFTTIGTPVVIIGASGDSLTPAKIVKVTKTQVTVDYRRGGETRTGRFIPSRWTDRYQTEMDQYGMRDSWNTPARLLLATDPSLPGRRAAAAKARAEKALKAAASKFAAQRHPTAADLDAMAAAMDAYRATLPATN